MTPTDTSGSPSFASALSTNVETAGAVRDVCDSVYKQLLKKPDLVFAFVSAHHSENAEALAAVICDRLSTDVLIGCTGESIVARGAEVELEPAISLWAACLPGTKVWPMRLEYRQSSDESGFIGWPDDLPAKWPFTSALLLLGDPFSFPADVLLNLVNEEHPNVPVIGGMASAGHEPGTNGLFLGRETFSDGAVAVLLDGNVRTHTLVSQGCRPIGRHFVVTRAERNVIHELGGMPAYKRLEEVFRTLPTRDQQRLQRGLHVGRVVSEYQDQFEQGDFLVRNVVGIDPDAGAIAIGDYVRAGQTVQFHVRDAESADGELSELLASLRDDPSANPKGALLFTCNGRGTRLFAEPNHDAGLVQAVLGDIPLAGFFAAGELGPISDKNFMHGFTASLAIFE